MMTTAKLKAPKITRCKPWPNGLGFDATVSGERFQVTSDRAIGRLVAIRETRDQGITHSHRICDDGSATWVEGDREVAALVYLVWRDRRADWISHV